MSARDRIREFFERNVGKVVTTNQIRRVASISEYARRIRELRNEEGMQIHSHLDDPALKPGEYMLVSLERLPAFGRGIPAGVRTRVLERNGYTCQLCGAAGGDPDPTNPAQKIRLHLDHVLPVSQGGSSDEDNLRVLCSACNQGRANIQPASEGAKNLLMRLRKAPRAVQREVYEALKRRFEGS